MEISVVMPTSRVDSVQATLRSIKNQDFADWELLAVGQGNLDDPRRKWVKEIVEDFGKHDPRISYHHTAMIGCCAGRNAGIAAARSDIIAIIDDDCEARADWLSTMVQIFKEEPTIDFVGGALIAPPPERRWFAVCPENIPTETVYDPVASNGVRPAGFDWAGGNFGIRRELAELVGPFDEYMGPGSTFPAADDTDFMFRLVKLGLKMASTPRLAVEHTYGYRYGILGFKKHQYNYAYGNGGLAGKLTLMGDPRGKDWLEFTRRESYSVDKLIRPHRFARSWWRWRVFKSAYEYCINNFIVRNDLLVPICKELPLEYPLQTQSESLVELGIQTNVK